MDLFRRSHRNTAVVPPIREVVVSQPGRKSLYRTVLGFLGSPLLPGEIVWREEITMIWLSLLRPGRAGHPSVPSDKKQVLINFQSAPELLSFLLNIQRV